MSVRWYQMVFCHMSARWYQMVFCHMSARWYQMVFFSLHIAGCHCLFEPSFDFTKSGCLPSKLSISVQFLTPLFTFCLVIHGWPLNMQCKQLRPQLGTLPCSFKYPSKNPSLKVLVHCSCSMLNANIIATSAFFCKFWFIMGHHWICCLPGCYPKI